MLRGEVTVNRYAIYMPHTLVKPPHQGLLFLTDGFHACLQQVVRRCIQSGNAVAVQRTGLQPCGVIPRLLPLEGMNAAAAPQQRTDVHPGTDTQPAGALRPHEPLVAGEAQYVHAQRGHVDRHRPCRLRGVQDQQRAVGMGHLRDTRHIRHIPRQVGGVGADHGSGVGAEKRREILKPNVALTVSPDEVQPHTQGLQCI